MMGTRNQWRRTILKLLPTRIRLAPLIQESTELLYATVQLIDEALNVLQPVFAESDEVAVETLKGQQAILFRHSVTAIASVAKIAIATTRSEVEDCVATGVRCCVCKTKKWKF